MKRFSIAFAFLLAFSLALGQEDQQQDQQQQAQQQAPSADQAAVRVAHLMPDGQAVSVRIDGETAIDSVEAGTVSEYMLVPTGQQEIELVAGGGGQQQDGQPDQQQEEPREEPQDEQEEEQQQEEQQQEEQQEGQEEQQDGQQAQEQGAQQLQQIQQSLGEAQEALQNDDTEQARQSLDEADDDVEQALQQAEGETQQGLQELQQSIQEAQQGLRNDDSRQAQDSLEQANQQLADTTQAVQQAQQQVGPEDQQQDQQQAGQEDQQQAIASESANLEGGGYYTIVLTSGQTQRADQQADQQDRQQTEEQADQQAEEQDQQQAEEQEDQQQAGQEDQQEAGQQGQQQDATVQVIQDDIQAAPAGTALVRVVHASPDLQNVSMVTAPTDREEAVADQPGEDEEVAGGGAADEQRAEQEGQEQEQQAGTLRITLDPEHAQDATIQVTGPDGFTQEAQGETTIEGLSEGTYFITATKENYQPGATQVDLQADRGAEAAVDLERLAEAGPVPIKGTTVVSGVSFGNASDYQAVEPGDFDTQLQAAEGDTVALELEGMTFEPGVSYSIFTFGSQEQGDLQVIVSVDALASQEDDSEQDSDQEDDSEQDSDQEGGGDA